MSEKEYTEGIAVKGRFLSWLDNFWYHNKWVTIGVAFFLIVGIVCFAQTCSKGEDDLVVLYAGRVNLTANEADGLASALTAIAPEDFDGNGKKSVALSAYNVMSEEQIRELSKETDELGKPVFVDKNYFTTQYDTYTNYVMTGESSVALLDPWLYEALLENNRLMSLEEALGREIAASVDGYGVRLGDLAVYDAYGVVAALPEDTVVCLLRPLWKGGKSSKPEYYEREKRMLEAILEYGAETQE